MKMSIARALKERKRIIGEMNTLWNRIGQNNLVQKNIKLVDGKFIQPSNEELAKMRKQDPKTMMFSWLKLRESLIALKTALHTANTGAAEKLARLSELKSELKLVETMPSYSNTTDYCGSDFVRIYDVVFDASWQVERADDLRREINTLQDEIDEYNATHFIELAD